MGAIAGATPLSSRDRVKPVPPREAIALPAPLPPVAPLAIDRDGDGVSARAPGVNRAQLAELRRGQIRAEATLDLHGLTTADAVPALDRFLLESARLRRRCVLIVHGKGTRSDGVAVLRELVLDHLTSAASGLVHAFAPAAPADGGAGASYVMVRS